MRIYPTAGTNVPAVHLVRRSSPLRYLVFIDYWNFQINWNRQARGRCDYQKLPGALVREAAGVLSTVESRTDTISLVETRLYASVDSRNEKDQLLKRWLTNTVNLMSSYRVDVRTRRTQTKPVFCRNCRRNTKVCPYCSTPFVRSVEKGVDAAIVTDMLLSGRKGLMDVAVIASSDADLVPAVLALSDHGIRTVNASWKQQGYELAKTCWGSFYVDDIAQNIVL